MKRYCIVLILFWMMPVLPVAAQVAGVSEMEKEALSYYQAKAYSKALADYNKLLEAYPRDPMYNYYAGVCMTELGQEPEKAIYRLKIASLKQVPHDVYFYLGRSAYNAGKYEEAVRWYTRFRDKATAGERKKYHLDKYITEAQMARQDAGKGTPPVAPKRSAQEQASVTALVYRHRADSLEQVVAGERKKLTAATNRMEKEDLQRSIANHERMLADYREQAGIWASRAGEGGEAGSNAYTLFGPGDNTTKVLAPVGAVSEREAAPFLELAGEDFYKNTDIRKIISPQDYNAFENYREMTRKGNGYMKEAWQREQETARQQMVVNTSASARERNRALNRINSLEKEKENKRLQAVQFFQQANDGEYALNKKYMALLLQEEHLPAARKKQGEAYRREAERNYGKALQLRDEAGSSPAARRYDKLMEANAYELMALDNQRKAMATLAGLMQVSDRDMAHVTVSARQPRPEPAVPPAVKDHPHNKGHHPTSARPAGVAHPATPAPPAKAAKTASPATPPPAALPEEKVYRKALPPKNLAEEKELSKYPFGLVMTQQSPYPGVGDIPADKAMPSGVNYRLQIGVFSRTPEMAWFRGMYPLFREQIPGKELTRYYAGQFRTYGEAAHALLKLREMGYKDAIVVGYYNGKRSPVRKVEMLEDEQPYVNILPGKSNQPPAGSAVTAKTLPGKKEKPPVTKEQQLVYRVQVGVFREPLPKEKLNALEEQAGWDHVVIRTRNNQGYYIYAIGNFATFDEAKAFRNKLAERGLSGCFVTAYKSGRRILIGTGSGN